MNIEEAQRVADKKRNAKKQQKIEEQTLNEQAIKDCTDFIKTRQIFKDLVSGREELFKKCIDYYFLTQLVPAINRNAMCNADYIAGFRDGAEMFLSVANVYDSKVEKLEQLKGGIR